MDDVRLIDANKLKAEAYKRFGLEAIKLITLVDEMPTERQSIVNQYGNNAKHIEHIGTLNI